MILLKLFLSFLKISCFAFGGKYSFIPLFEKELVLNRGWIDNTEFLNVLGIGEIVPGALSVKFATYTGYKVAGVAGVIAANLGNLIAPAILILIVSLAYANYKDIPVVKAAFAMLRCAIFAMLIATTVQLAYKSNFLEFKYLIVMAIAFALFFIKVNPAFIIIGAGAIGAMIEYMNLG